MSEVMTETEAVVKDVLYEQYGWYYNSFLPAIQKGADEFFSEFFDFSFISLSKNVNVLFSGDDYFVTKIRIDKQHDAFFRCSSNAIKIILDKVLGPNKKFNISNITELEAKIISSFNDSLYNHIEKFLSSPPKDGKKRKNFDTIHLTFFLKDKTSDDIAKLIVSLPQVLVEPRRMIRPQKKFDVSNFNQSLLDVKLKIGKTKFPLKEIKHLEKGDTVVFEESNVNYMEIFYKDYRKVFQINPNPGLITSIDNDNGGHNMEEQSLSQSMWDNIQVEMEAEFDKVKITLGELKGIDQGVVLDLSSVYDNKIFLKVENKTIATGELIIINDRYGVKINEVFASEKQEEPVAQQETIAPVENIEQAEAPQPAAGNAEEEFDYSDFELEDQDI